MAISAVLLAYKEAENLRVLLPRIREQLQNTGEDFEIVVIDTEKPLDNTAEVCGELGARYVNQRYPYFGGAFRTGIEEAKYDKFLIMDSDGSHNPKYIGGIYQRFTQGADIVIGSRYTKGGATNDARSSIVMSRILNTVFRIITGIRAKDISTDFRMYDTAQLKRVQLTCRNYDVLQEVLMKMKINNRGIVIEEVPISFDKRLYGESKRRLIPFILGYIKTMFKLIGLRISCGRGKEKNDD